MSDMAQRIRNYFATVSDDELQRDVIEAGFTIRCKTHSEFDPLNPVPTDCLICQNLVDSYAKSKRFGSGTN